MANRPALINQADATRLFKAAKAAGYERARLVKHPDGRVELVAERAQPADRDAGSSANEWDEVLS